MPSPPQTTNFQSHPSAEASEFFSRLVLTHVPFYPQHLTRKMMSPFPPSKPFPLQFTSTPGFLPTLDWWHGFSHCPKVNPIKQAHVGWPLYICQVEAYWASHYMPSLFSQYNLPHTLWVREQTK